MKQIIYITFLGLLACASVKEQEIPQHDWDFSITDSIVIPGDVIETKLFSFHDDLTPVLNTVTGKYGFVNPKGGLAIPCIYGVVREFHCGRAAVMNIESRKWGYINKENELIIPFIYDYVSDFGYDRFEESGFDGLAYVNIGLSCPEDHFRLFTDGKWGLINTDGEVVLPIKYGDIYSPIENMASIAEGEWVNEYHPDGEDFLCFKGKMGFINRKMEIVIPVEYDFHRTYFEKGYVTLMKDGVLFKFNMKGKIINE